MTTEENEKNILNYWKIMIKNVALTFTHSVLIKSIW